MKERMENRTDSKTQPNLGRSKLKMITNQKNRLQF